MRLPFEKILTVAFLAMAQCLVPSVDVGKRHAFSAGATSQLCQSGASNESHNNQHKNTLTFFYKSPKIIKSMNKLNMKCRNAISKINFYSYHINMVKK